MTTFTSSDSATASSNYTIVYDALRFFRNSMLPFVIDKLHKHFGKGWWEQGVKAALNNDVCKRLEKDFERRYGKQISVIKRPGTETYEMLDINRFLPIITKHWRCCFEKTFKQRDTVEVWLREINDARNIVSHPETDDISDNDAWRALDTTARLISIINPSTGSQIEAFKKNIGRVHSQENPVMRDGPYDYSLGIPHLKKNIMASEGEESEIYLDIVGYEGQLRIVLSEMEISPGVEISDLEHRKNKLLRQLETLSLEYCKKGFREMSLVTRTQTLPGTSIVRVRELRDQIEKLKSTYRLKQIKKIAQLQTGEQVRRLEREIETLSDDIQRLEFELDHLRDIASPDSFFRINRYITPGKSSFSEEEPFTVNIEFTNLGKKASFIDYMECIPDCFRVTKNKAEISSLVQPGGQLVHKFECYSVATAYYHDVKSFLHRRSIDRGHE